MLLREHDWQFKYTPADGNLLARFYVPLLRCALRYDRTTGFYSAQTLAAAADGVEALVANGGKMRLIAGCTLEKAEVEAIRRGESLRDTVEAKLLASPFADQPARVRDSLELLAWMVANGYLEIKIAIPCDPATAKPLANDYIFHEKAGIVEDKAGDRLVFNGSLNETLAAWQSRNWDSFHVFCSWKMDAGHLDADESSFQRLWANREPTALVLGLGEAVKKRLLEFLPKGDRLPARLEPVGTAPEPAPEITPPDPEPDRLRQTWEFIRTSPALSPQGDRVGEATAAVAPWPHQAQAFRRMYGHWPPRLLIADEVGLGKTIQAGLLLRQAWLAGKARRVLIMAPKAVLWQWQLELREKFNLNFPVYDNGSLAWRPSPAIRGRHIEPVADADWHKQPFLLVSSQLMRRRERARQLLEEAEPWDLIILDEAHHARRKGGPGEVPKNVPNQLLRLMRQLKKRAKALLLLTATPMQIHPVEVWDLLDLLGMPPGWTERQFIDFFEYTAHPCPDNAMLAKTARLFREVEEFYGPLELERALQIGAGHTKLGVRRALNALRSNSDIPRNNLPADLRRLAMRLMRRHNPVAMLISRHTRELLRKYRDQGKIASNIASRNVHDVMTHLSGPERRLYEAVEDYISATYNKADASNRSAVGFVMTIYRKRLASSFYALEQTLKNRLASLAGKKRQADFNDEDLPDDELNDEQMQDDDAARQEQEALRAEEKGEIGRLLAEIKKLPMDTKARELLETIKSLQKQGYEQIIIFTQYTDTLDFLRDQLIRAMPEASALCFSGRGGERWQNGLWQQISRDRVKELFKNGQAGIMLCTDAAAEGLNFQFCGALINYDMPWNPMKVEQRIGRIDRLGQKYGQIQIVNFMYANTVEADVYQTLRERIELFGAFVGKLQPILARLPAAIGEIALAGPQGRERLDQTLQYLQAEIETSQNSSFDLDEASDAELDLASQPPAAYDLAWLENVLADKALLPPGHEAETLYEHKDYKYRLPGMAEAIRVTCDANFYADHSESVELWSPGSPAFPWQPQ